jgi:hypothetical protein
MLGNWSCGVENLQNYRNLVARVDELCRRIAAEFGEYLACGEGCDGCCRHVSLFPVEAVALAAALGGLPAKQAAHIRDRARAASTAACPLLENGRCLLYATRPIICRTHGMPLLIGQEGGKRIDFCPKNFRGVASIPAAAVINLDLLNATLAAINAVFSHSCRNSAESAQQRFSVAEALLLGG